MPGLGIGDEYCYENDICHGYRGYRRKKRVSWTHSARLLALDCVGVLAALCPDRQEAQVQAVKKAVTGLVRRGLKADFSGQQHAHDPHTSERVSRFVKRAQQPFSVPLIASSTPDHSTGDLEMGRPWGRCSIARRLEPRVIQLVMMYDDKDEDNSSSELQGAGRSAVDVVQDAAI